VVLDIAMRGMNGFGVAQALLTQREAKPEILALTAYDQVAYVRAMLKLGIKGYWLKAAQFIVGRELLPHCGLTGDVFCGILFAARSAIDICPKMQYRIELLIKRDRPVRRLPPFTIVATTRHRSRRKKRGSV
jgi:DNA-binding LytR/AlgR family response regulator